MPKFSDDTIEKKVLSLFFVSPFHTKVIEMDITTFSKSENVTLVNIIKQYVMKYNSVPTKDTLITFTNEKIKDEKTAELYTKAMLLLNDLPKILPEEAPYYLEKAEDLRVGRKLYDLHDMLSKSFEEHAVNFKDLQRKVMQNTLLIGSDVSNIKRGYIYKNVKERFDQYTVAEQGKRQDLIPYGMKQLDENMGGMKKSFVNLIYAKTGGGKSRFGINVAYNCAMSGHSVLWLSLEMEFNILANCFDSRMAALDSKHIIFGKLEKENKKKFYETLKQQAKDKLNIWISDIPKGATTASIFEEMEIYKANNGMYPDVLIVDYANLLEPMLRYGNRSEKYDYLFKELKEIARYYSVSLLTMAQESREASKDDIKGSGKKKSGDDEYGTHKIGLSNYAATHCEGVIRLKQLEADSLKNRVWAIIDKNRYGASRKKIPLFAAWDITYIGDRNLEDSKRGIVLN